MVPHHAPSSRALTPISKPGRRPPLDRRRIVAAATAFIDDQGLAQLTMRRLGAVLEVEAMALYRYVPSREDLLDEVALTLVDDLLDGERTTVRPPHWRGYLRTLAHAVRDHALTHPEVFAVAVGRRPATSWLRPPLSSPRFVDSFAGSLAACGLSDLAVARTYRAFSSFLLGHLLLEVLARRRPVGGDPGDLSSLPHLRALMPTLTGDDGLTEFDDALEDLLGSLDGPAPQPV